MPINPVGGSSSHYNSSGQSPEAQQAINDINQLIQDVNSGVNFNVLNEDFLKCQTDIANLGNLPSKTEGFVQAFYQDFNKFQSNPSEFNTWMLGESGKELITQPNNY